MFLRFLFRCSRNDQGLSLGVLALLSASACAEPPRSTFQPSEAPPPPSQAAPSAPPSSTSKGEPDTLPSETVVFGGSGSDPRCIPVASTESACDGKDDDCNGLIDDVDPGHDGLCDCVKIAILGKAGTYESSNFQQWLTTRGTTVLRMQEEGKPALTKASLANFDMVILDWLQRDYGTNEIAEFDEWLQQGHGVLALSGYSDTYPASRPNGFLARVGFALSPSTSIPGRQVVHQFLPHPLTEGLSAISFYGGSEVSLAGKVSPDAKRTAFASFEDKVVGGVYEMPNHGARAVVWGDEWVEFDSEWSALPEIARFWSNIVSFLAPKCQLPPHPIR